MEGYANNKARDDSFLTIEGHFYRIRQILENRASNLLYFAVRKLNVVDVLFNDFNEYEVTENCSIINITRDRAVFKCLNITFTDTEARDRKFLIILKHYLLLRLNPVF